MRLPILSLAAMTLLVPVNLLSAAEKEATALAAEMRKLMLQYDAAIEAKAAKEEQFYLEQRQVLRDLWLPGAVPEKIETTVTESDSKQVGGKSKKVIVKKPAIPIEESVKQSVPFQLITRSAYRNSLKLAEELSVNPGISRPYTSLVEQLELGLREDRVAYESAQARQQQLRAELGATLAEIDLQEGRRKEIRDALLKLEAGPSVTQQLKQVYEIGKAVQGQLKKKPEAKDK